MRQYEGQSPNCAGCGKETKDGIPPVHLGWYKTSDGFEEHWPTCGCGKYLVCPDCKFEFGNPDSIYYPCPKCGCDCEYT